MKASFLRFNLADVFSIDLRSLAVVRILVAIIILVDLASRVQDLIVFYGDKGVLPSSLLQTFWAGEWAWSIHLLGGGAWQWVGFLFLVQAIFAAFLLLGYWTRLATIVTWVLIVSLHNVKNILVDRFLMAVLEGDKRAEASFEVEGR